jgi:hypothetical protein
MAHPAYKPTPAEAQFLGELVVVDSELAKVALKQFKDGWSLDSVVSSFKDAMKISAILRGPAA